MSKLMWVIGEWQRYGGISELVAFIMLLIMWVAIGMLLFLCWRDAFLWYLN